MIASYHKYFKKTYKRLNSKLKEKANERILLFLEDPYSQILNNHALSGKYTGCRSINITGDLRAIYIPKKHGLVFFVCIDTHSNLYK